jgi:hypothetical protein
MYKFSVLLVFVLCVAGTSTAQAKWKLYEEGGGISPLL